jgi:hypothetical protein
MLHGSTFVPLPMAIAAFAMIALLDSQPYVFGGLNSSFTAFNTVYTFDTTNAWDHAHATAVAVSRDSRARHEHGDSVWWIDD